MIFAIEPPHDRGACEDCDYARRRRVASLCTLPEERASTIRFLRDQDEPPPRWASITPDGDRRPIAQIESRAWIEWRRRHRPASVPGSKIPRSMREAVIDRDGYVCGICGGDIDRDGPIDIDHIKPVSRGGATEMGNLRAAHAKCNRRRGNRENGS